MKTKTALIIIPVLFIAGGARAADEESEFKLYGSVSLGVWSVDSSSTRDAAKLNEYRDLDSGVFGGIKIKGRGDDFYVDVLGENLGRDDQYVNVKGGQYDVFKYRVYDNKSAHNWAFDALTPYDGVGSNTLTGTLPNLDTTTWNKYDLGLKRDDTGVMVEVSNKSPWFVRVDANQVKDDGLKLIAGSNGTSPGNGFADKPMPLGSTTRNFSVEGGYASKRGQLSASVLYSKFSNDQDELNWTNAFFGSQLDTMTLPSDNEYLKYGINGTLKQLPMDSTLAVRLTQSRTWNDIPIATTALNTGGVYDATNPDRSSFEGDVVHKTASLSLHSNPTEDLDTRVYWNQFEKDNRSTHVEFTNLAVGLTCGRIVQGVTVINPGDCSSETLSYDRKNYGFDVGYRLDKQNRVLFGYDYSDLTRDRIDFDETKDQKISLEYKNTSFDSMSTRLKYQNLRRRSHFLEADAGTDANDDEYLNRFIARFDSSNLDQHLVKLALDAAPAESLDVGLEFILKRNQYPDTTLGRTSDNRSEIYFSIGYGDIQTFRVLFFADLEKVRYDSTHRNISTVSSGSGSAPNGPPSGDCQSTAPNCYDPGTAPTNSNYNWDARNEDTNTVFGLGADWTVSTQTKLNASLTSERTHGTVDFSVQPGALPSTPAVDIPNYDNSKKFTFNVKGTYAYSATWSFTGGYAYEKYRFDDISYKGYDYTIGAGTSASYLSGAYAFPEYTTRIVYLIGTCHF